MIGAGGRRPGGRDDEALRAVETLLEAGTPRRVAVDTVAALVGVPRNLLYRASL